MRSRRKYPKCPTCGAPLPTRRDPSFDPDEEREIMRRLTLLELRLAEKEEQLDIDGDVR